MCLLPKTNTICHEPRSQFYDCRPQQQPDFFCADGRFYPTQGAEHRRAFLTQVRLLLVRRTRTQAPKTAWWRERDLSHVGPKRFFGSNRPRRSFRFHPLPGQRSINFLADHHLICHHSNFIIRLKILSAGVSTEFQIQQGTVEIRLL